MNAMELREAVEHILDGTAVLFAGAGFSYGAKNMYDDVPNAAKLKEQLLIGLGYDSSTYAEHSLETLASVYKKKIGADSLVELLKKQYTILQVADYHEQLALLKWKRIYTTNYDQTIEIASKSESYGQPCFRDAIIMSDDFDSIDKNSICIHLNGYIERLTEDKLDSEFKLTDRSYSCDTLNGNPWLELMANDFEAASVIAVVGYSMQYDLDIKRMLATPEISKKVIFITSPNPNPIDLVLLEDYGTCLSIGVKAFSEEIEKAKNNYVPRVASAYKSFRHWYHDTRMSEAPSYEEIVGLYAVGFFSEKLLSKDCTGMYKYLLNRRAMDVFLANYRTQKVFIAISNLGNGKSVFLDMVINELRQEDVNVFKYTQRFQSIDEEIAAICNERKHCVVIIDNYPGHMDILKKFAYYGCGNITFLLTARTSVNQMFYKRLENTLRIRTEEIRPLYLNEIKNSKEVKELALILADNKLLPAELCKETNNDTLEDFITNECNGYFSALLLKLFESSNIKEKLVQLYMNLERNKNVTVKRIAIFILLKSVSNYELSIPQIYDLFQADYLKLKEDEDEFVQEIFTKQGDTGLAVRSSVIAKYLIKHVIKLEDIVDTMKTAFLAADKKQGTDYSELQKSMVSHSQFRVFANVNNDDTRKSLIETFYDDIRNTNFAKDNTFFWEQFASAYIDMNKFDMVEQCLENAFSAAEKIPGFVPFQVKTVQGRYFIEKASFNYTSGTCSASEAVESIRRAANVILAFYDNPENNRYYVFKVVSGITRLYNLIEKELNDKELSICIQEMSILSKQMGDFILKNPQAQNSNRIYEWKDDLVKAIESAKGILKGKLQK